MSDRVVSSRTVPLGRLIILLQALIALAFTVYILRGDHVRIPLLSSTDSVQIAFEDASGLGDDDRHPVMIAGVRVGEITDVAYRDRRAVATARLDGGTADRLRRDATAVVVPRSALQDQTVELSPGTAQAPLGDRMIEVDRRAAPVELDRVVATLDADTRAQTQILLGELERATDDAGPALRAGIRALGPALDSSRRVADALADRRVILTRLVGELDEVFTTLAGREADIRGFLDSGRRTVEVIGARDAETAATVRALPGTLATLDTALDDTRAVADPLERALDGLRPVAARLPEGLASTREIIPSARALLDALAPVARSGRAPARSLARALRSLRPAAQSLAPAVARLEPVLKDIDANKSGIRLLGERFSGVFSTSDANGPILRGLGFFEAFDPAAFGEKGATGSRLRALKADADAALESLCPENLVACIARALVPGLPEAVRSATASIGSATRARASATKVLADPARRAALGLTPRPREAGG